MKEKTLRFLEAHESHEASSFVDEAKWRQENNAWIRWSQSIALKIVDFMKRTIYQELILLSGWDALHNT